MEEQIMSWKKAGIIAGVTTGVFLGMKYVFPVILPFFLGWILAEAVHVPVKKICERPVSKKMHLSENILGIVFIILGILLAVLGIFFTLQYFTGKLSGCVKYYPEFKRGGTGYSMEILPWVGTFYRDTC